MDNTIGAGIISAAVAIIGTFAAGFGRKSDSSDRRMELTFKAAQDLVNDLRGERSDLIERITKLEEDRETDRLALGQLRDSLRDQHTEMMILQVREAELRAWTVDIMAWAAMAVGIIRSMGGQIDSPPSPPSGHHV